jgi:Asp-tRNA(Asn)/Glu-tRNA(Gln) amidotransferase C subunit
MIVFMAKQPTNATNGRPSCTGDQRFLLEKARFERVSGAKPDRLVRCKSGIRQTGRGGRRRASADQALRSRPEPAVDELSQILTWIEQLNEVDSSGIALMASVGSAGLPMREDRVTDGSRREKCLPTPRERLAVSLSSRR